jgi:hypothetical protein
MVPKLLVALAAVLLVGEAEAPRIDVATLTPEQIEARASWVKEHGEPPVDYLVGKFADHDVVFVGENHWIRENCRFVRDALEPLYREAGVRALATEFVYSRFADDLNRIVTAPEYDEAGVIAIFREGPWPIWGFREYEEIFRAVWEINRKLGDGEEPMRVIPLDGAWSQHALWFEPDKRKQFEMRLARERHMTKTLDEQAFGKGVKTLVHCGSGHALTSQGERLAAVLWRKYGKRLFQLHLHAEIPGRGGKSRFSPTLETIFAKAGGQPIGFDVIGSPLDELVDPTAVWWRFMPEARFSGFAQGYVFLVPTEELHRVRWIEGFVTKEKFEEALAICRRCGWAPKEGCSTPEELDAALAKRFAGERISGSR